MYGMEACVLGAKVLKELEDRQKRIAAFVTGLSRSGGNVALILESGLMPMKIRYHMMFYRYFNRLMSLDSGLLFEALGEHIGRWKSKYKEACGQLRRMYGLEYLSSKASLSKISEVAWADVLEQKYRLKSLRFLSVSAERWELPGHVNDSRGSRVLCKLRVGNVGLGNRVPLKVVGHVLKECPLCSAKGLIQPLNESHVILDCEELKDVQESMGVKNYRMAMRGLDTEYVMWSLLGKFLFTKS